MAWGYVMTRAWKVPPTSFAAFTVISNVWNVIGKLLVGTVLLGGALFLGATIPPGLHGILVVCSMTVVALRVFEK